MKLIATQGDQEATFELKKGLYTIGRSQSASIALPSNWLLASGLHMQIRLDDNGSAQVRDGSGEKPSRNGTQLNNRFISSNNWSEWKRTDELKIGNHQKESIRLSLIDKVDLDSNMVVKSDKQSASVRITIGRGAECDVCIQGFTISRLHCEIKRISLSTKLFDYSKNGVYINGQKVMGTYDLKGNDEIKIGTHVFLWTGERLIKETSGSNYRIDVRDLWLEGRIRGTSLSIEPGQLVAFVGGSGAGKSSLLTTIVGQNMGYVGNIQINGNELRDSYKSIKQDIGFVPQDDIVHMDLTVEEVLRYSARLKLPDIETQREGVERVLNELEIGHRRKARVRELSGGQRKRVSIGVELIADPRILFLDEPTSGLDPGLDKRMMELLKSLAISGRTVALVTHATNNVMLCDQVVFLGRGGYLCYAGPPKDCTSHFGVRGDFSDVYQYLEKEDDEIQRISHAFAQNQAHTLKVVENHDRTPVNDSYSTWKRFRNFIPQLTTLLSRDIKLQLRDGTSLALNAITAPLAALMIAIAANSRDVFSNHSNASINAYSSAQRILFVVVCSAIWVGLSSSLQVIVKEKQIFKRERSFNLLPEAYLFAKVIVMLLSALIQALFLVTSVSFLFEAPGGVDNWPLLIGITSFLTLAAIGSQALLFSSVVKNSQQASSIAPLLLIPQLVFGGVLFQLSDSANGIYSFIASRWSMILMGAFSEITSLIPGATESVSRVVDASSYVNTSKNILEAIYILIAQFVIQAGLTLASLLFYKKNLN